MGAKTTEDRLKAIEEKLDAIIKFVGAGGIDFPILNDPTFEVSEEAGGRYRATIVLRDGCVYVGSGFTRDEAIKRLCSFVARHKFGDTVSEGSLS